MAALDPQAQALFATMCRGDTHITVESLQSVLREIMSRAQATDDPYDVAASLIEQMDVDGDGVVTNTEVGVLESHAYRLIGPSIR